MDLVFVRHAEPFRIEESEGPADPELTERGHTQSDAVARWLAAEKFDVLYSSPLRRALQTAEHISKQTGLAIQICDDIREYDAGFNAYIPYEQLKAARAE